MRQDNHYTPDHSPAPALDLEVLRPILMAVLERYLEDAGAAIRQGMLAPGAERLLPCAGCPAWYGLREDAGLERYLSARTHYGELAELWDHMRELAVRLGIVREVPTDAQFLGACLRALELHASVGMRQRASEARNYQERRIRRLEDGEAAKPLRNVDERRAELLRRMVDEYRMTAPKATWRRIWMDVPNPYATHRVMRLSLYQGAAAEQEEA